MNSISFEQEQSASCPAWFALRVRARSEEKAVSGLRPKGYELLSPTYPVRRRYSDRVKTTEAPLFPGYVFCRFAPASRFTVLNSPGVTYIVGFGGQPMPLADADIEAIQRATTAGASPVPYLKAGQRVRIGKGYLEGLEGLLLRTANESRVIISVDMLHRSIAVNVDTDDISPA